MSLNESEIARYLRDGYLFPVSGVAAAQAALWRQRLEEIEAAGVTAGNGSWANPEFRSWEHDDHPLREPIEEIVRHPRLLQLVTALIGPNVFVRNVDIFSKVPVGLYLLRRLRRSHRAPQGIGLHRDSAVFAAENDGSLTVWLALAHVTRLSGALRYYPGSHRWQIAEAPDSSDNLDLSHRESEIVAGRRSVRATLLPGQIAIHHAQTLHASPENFTRRHRIGVAIRYFSASVPPEVSQCSQGVLVTGSADHSAYVPSATFSITWWYPHRPPAEQQHGQTERRT